MAKYSFTINSDDPKEISSFVAFMNNGASIPTLIHSTAANINTNGLAVDDPDDNAPPNPNAPQFDAAGIPWDDRIHSKNKGMTNDRMWRKKRGVAETTVAAVEAELKQRGAQGAGMYMPPPAPQFQLPPVQTYAPPPQNYQPPPVQQQNYAPPPQGYQPPPVNYAPPGVQPPSAPMDFTQFMNHVSAQLPKRDANNQPMMDGNYLGSVCQRLSAQTGRPFSAITDLASQPDCIPLAVQFMQSDGRW